MTGREHLAMLHSLPCAVTYALTGKRVYGVVVHHPEAVRDDMSHFQGIPMTDEWHKHLHAISRRGFTRLTKLTEMDLLGYTMKLVGEHLANG